jgi:hypothetical protein
VRADKSGHAVRMAIDMGINKSFAQLMKNGMGKGKSLDELEEERYLVVHARVWFCVRLTPFGGLWLTVTALPDGAPVCQSGE